jgi:L-threonylcarbamoyladenylate synthase
MASASSELAVEGVIVGLERAMASLMPTERPRGKRKGCALRAPPMPRVLAVDPLRPEAAAVSEAVRVLRGGGLVAFPTETVYGLGASALDETAVLRVFAAKGRPLGHPLIAHVESDERARTLARAWPEMASRLSKAFWPGPITLVVERASHVPKSVSGGGDSIAMRAPSHRVALALIEGLGGPIAAPSANRHQHLSPTTALHVVKQLGDAVDLVLDAGPCDAGIESTVVDVRGRTPRVLRPGVVSLAQLRVVLPAIEGRAETAPDGRGRASPGMAERHYAPRARLLVADTAAIARSLARGLLSEGISPGIVAYEDSSAPEWPEGALVRVLERTPEGYARLLYATLHELDEAGVQAILVVRVPESEAWWAIADRLQRASAH